MRGTIKNRLAKHYLRHWGYFDNNLEYLTNAEEVKMKTLYAALKELDPNDRKFLASKYRVKVRSIVRDDELAEQSGMTLEEYRAKRIEIETKLQVVLDTKMIEYKEEFHRACDIDFGR